MIFKQRKAKLYNGTTVQEGDKVMFVNSDGEECVGRIERDCNNLKRLFFWNSRYDIADYKTAVKL